MSMSIYIAHRRRKTPLMHEYRYCEKKLDRILFDFASHHRCRHSATQQTMSVPFAINEPQETVQIKVHKRTRCSTPALIPY